VISDIGDKTKVINDIVFQTKLLSFNASVEAARAGEQGKGFAVVAEEVGNLARMSGNAAKEISDMLDQSILKVRTIVQETKSSVQNLVEQGKSKVASGSEIAKECGHVLEEIVVSVSTVSRMSGEISVASSEQAQGVQEITKAVHQLDEVTQKNSATTHETATAAQHLASQADSLKHIVENLVMTVDGKVSGSYTDNVVEFEKEEKKLMKAKSFRESA
jgi:methyl-accepting chemotaxis protein